MGNVGVKELKNRLTHYLRQAKQGEEVVVTERGKPVALLHPIGSARPVKSREAKLARLASQGFLTLPTRKPSQFRPPVRAKGPLASRLVLEDRR